MSIVIGRVVEKGKVHMTIDGVGCGPCRRRPILTPVAHDMLSWIAPGDLCKHCFREERVATASTLNAFSDSRWSHGLDLFLTRVPVITTRYGRHTTIAPEQEHVSPERLAQMTREIIAMLERNIIPLPSAT